MRVTSLSRFCRVVIFGSAAAGFGAIAPSATLLGAIALEATVLGAIALGAVELSATAQGATVTATADVHAPPDADAHERFEPFKPESTTTQGSVSVGGQSIAYQAIAGTLIVHPKGWDDVPHDPKQDSESGAPAADGGQPKNPTAAASMFYVAYFKPGASSRPVTFLYNGGPGSATLWLHMGAFGPRRVVTATDAHTAAAPYSIVNNGSSLLDVSDLVFIDAPGTGFSRIAGKDKEKAFYGVDPDAYAFAEFIVQFLDKYGRWNSPKYLFGESYGTPRSAVLINQLESARAVDFNGVILLSQILSFDLSADRPSRNPGVDLPYEVVLPTYAATAWYHHVLPHDHPDLEGLIAEVERFAMGDYANALAAGSDLAETQREAIADRLHEYTGLSMEYILKADLRIDGGEFRQNVQAHIGAATGRLDSRFSGPLLDPLSQRTDYDPQSAAIGSAYVSAFNEYVRRELHYGAGQVFKPSIPIFRSWNPQHQLPGQEESFPSEQGLNVMPDLANAMKLNPTLKIQLHAGYFDLATPFYQGIYEMHHLPIPADLRANIEYKFYESGHMVYAKDSSLKLLHDNVAAFIRRTESSR